jgi:hypothetical protein
MKKLVRKHQVLIVMILILLPIFLFSYPNASSSWQPRAHGDPAPTGTILTVTATPDNKILVRMGTVVPSPKCTSCDIMLVPPGNQAKLLKIEDQSYESYNETIGLDVLPSDPIEHQNLTSNVVKMNDLLVINCSRLGNIPEGRWSIFLMFLEDPITSATWTVNDTPAGNQPLSFMGTGVSDPMLNYGFVHSPQYGYFWSAIFFFSGVALIVLIVGLYASLRKDGKGKSP